MIADGLGLIWSKVKNYVSSSLSTKADANHTHTAAEVGARPSTWKPTWSDIQSKPSTFSPSSHTHPWSQITNVPSSITSGGSVKIFHARGHSTAVWEESDPPPLNEILNTADVTLLSDNTIKINKDMTVLVYASGRVVMSYTDTVTINYSTQNCVKVTVNGSGTVICWTRYKSGVQGRTLPAEESFGMYAFSLKANDIVAFWPREYSKGSTYQLGGLIHYCGIIQLS